MNETATAYVASAAWIRRRAPQLLDDFIDEVMREGGITVEEWNEACASLANYANRNSDGLGDQFVALMGPITGGER